jgi:hypothetical protein
MSETIIATLITAAATILVVIFQNRATANKVTAELEKHQAVTDTKMDELTREVREHNNFARRMPVVEEQIKVINHRIADLEAKDK